MLTKKKKINIMYHNVGLLLCIIAGLSEKS